MFGFGMIKHNTRTMGFQSANVQNDGLAIMPLTDPFRAFDVRPHMHILPPQRFQTLAANRIQRGVRCAMIQKFRRLGRRIGDRAHIAVTVHRTNLPTANLVALFAVLIPRNDLEQIVIGELIAVTLFYRSPYQIGIGEPFFIERQAKLIRVMAQHHSKKFGEAFKVGHRHQTIFCIFTPTDYNITAVSAGVWPILVPKFYLRLFFSLLVLFSACVPLAAVFGRITTTDVLLAYAQKEVAFPQKYPGSFAFQTEKIELYLILLDTQKTIRLNRYLPIEKMNQIMLNRAGGAGAFVLTGLPTARGNDIGNNYIDIPSGRLYTLFYEFYRYETSTGFYTLSPDGSKIAYATSRVSDILVLDLATGENHVIAKGSRTPQHVAWSPIGDRLAVASQNMLTLVNFDGTNPVEYPQRWDNFTVDWLPDGRHVMLIPQQPYNALMLVDTQTGETRRWTVAEPLDTPLASCDGQYLAYLSDARQVNVLDLATGTTFNMNAHPSLEGENAFQVQWAFCNQLVIVMSPEILSARIPIYPVYLASLDGNHIRQIAEATGYYGSQGYEAFVYMRATADGRTELVRYAADGTQTPMHIYLRDETGFWYDEATQAVFFDPTGTSLVRLRAGDPTKKPQRLTFPDEYIFDVVRLTTP